MDLCLVDTIKIFLAYGSPVTVIFPWACIRYPVFGTEFFVSVDGYSQCMPLNTFLSLVATLRILAYLVYIIYVQYMLLQLRLFIFSIRLLSNTTSTSVSIFLICCLFSCLYILARSMYQLKRGMLWEGRTQKKKKIITWLYIFLGAWICPPKRTRNKEQEGMVKRKKNPFVAVGFELVQGVQRHQNQGLSTWSPGRLDSLLLNLCLFSARSYHALSPAFSFPPLKSHFILPLKTQFNSSCAGNTSLLLSYPPDSQINAGRACST